MEADREAFGYFAGRDMAVHRRHDAIRPPLAPGKRAGCRSGAVVTDRATAFDHEAPPARDLPARELPIVTPAGGFVGPVKRSVTIAGHPTSISLEPVFWLALDVAARVRALPLNALIARIDALRIAGADPPNLASALRSWLLANVVENGSH